MSTDVEGVVVGYDGSPAAGAAVDWAAREAAAAGRGLTVLYATAMTGVLPGPIGPSPWLPARAMEQAGDVAEEGAQRARRTAPDLTVATVATDVGNPARSLVHASRTADLVVVGSRGEGDAVGGLLGSVATAVAAHAGCDVVVVPVETAAGAGPGPVVVGYDGSPDADTALDAAAEHARRHGAVLRLVTAYPTPPPRSWEADYWVATRPGLTPHDAARASAEDVLRRGRERVGETVPVEGRVEEGSPATALVRAAQDAALLVVGSRGRGGFVSLLLGSVSRSVLQHARCPVLVAHRGPADAAAGGAGTVEAAARG